MSLRKAAGAVSLMTFFSRIFGLVRDQLFAALLGAGFYSDAYVIAFRIPNLLRDLFAEGALSSAFVPTFTDYDVKRSKADAWQLANLVIGTLLALVGTLTLIAMIFAPALVAFVAPGFGEIPGKGELTILLTRIMFPFLPTVALAAVFMGMLNSKERYGVPAFAPVMFNIVSIAVGLFLWGMSVEPRVAVIGWSIGTLLGGLAQAFTQVPSLWKLGWKFRPTLQGYKKSDGLRQIGKLMLPAVIGLSATQVNILVNSILASMLEQGSPSWLNYAFRLVQLPIGIFGVAIGVVTLSKVSKDAARASKEAFQQNLTTSLNFVFLLTLPSAVGLWILGQPIVRLIYEHGAFQASDTAATAAALSFYALGLPAYAAVKVLAPAFFALKDAHSPMKSSIVAMILNVGFNVAMYKTFGYRGLAIGTSISATSNFLLLFYWLQTKHGGIPIRIFLDRFFRTLFATAIMGVAVQYALSLSQHRYDGWAGRIIETAVPMMCGVAVYAAALALFRVPEAVLATNALKQIYRRFFPS